jgi:hypothetical protein
VGDNFEPRKKTVTGGSFRDTMRKMIIVLGMYRLQFGDHDVEELSMVGKREALVLCGDLLVSMY